MGKRNEVVPQNEQPKDREIEIDNVDIVNEEPNTSQTPEIINSRANAGNFKFSISTSGTGLPEHTDEIDPHQMIVEDDD
jgi:hypothetical protein